MLVNCISLSCFSHFISFLLLIIGYFSSIILYCLFDFTVGKSQINKFLRDTSLIEDRDLSFEVYLVSTRSLFDLDIRDNAIYSA